MAMKAKDLAKKLGISPASVSLVLNNKPGVSEKTRQMVLDALTEYGCENLMADSPKEKKTVLFLVYRKNVAKVEESPYFSQIFSGIIEGVECQVKNCGYKLMVAYVDSLSIVNEVARIREEEIDGLLILATEMIEEQMKLFTDMHVPTIIIDNYMENKDMDCVAINNEQGVDLAITHLVNMGHRDIGYLHIEGNANNFVERYYGFLRAVRENALELNEEHILSFTTHGGDDLYLQLKKQLSQLSSMPTAFFADNDIVAIWATKVLREIGYRVPQDVSLVGFDNISLSQMIDPALTTIQTPKYPIGCVAVNLLANKIEGKLEDVFDGIQKVEMKTTLIQRQSVMQRV
ncbi:LacI family DNA-binding transcriptional regulator [Vallitaleaceae bacterium 9-2]